MGYRYTILDPWKYFEGHPNRNQLVGLPQEFWDRKFYITLIHKDNPNRAKYNGCLEFDITDCSIKRQFYFYHFSVDGNRRRQGEGVRLIKGMAGVAQELGFNKIDLAGTYLDNDKGTLNKQGQVANILDWFEGRFPKVGNLRQRLTLPNGHYQECTLQVKALL